MDFYSFKKWRKKEKKKKKEEVIQKYMGLKLVSKPDIISMPVVR